MGNGDLMLYNCYDKEQRYLEVVAFSECDTQKIGSSSPSKGTPMDEVGTIKAILAFTDPRSISVLIEKLTMAQLHMLDRLITTTPKSEEKPYDEQDLINDTF